MMMKMRALASGCLAACALFVGAMHVNAQAPVPPSAMITEIDTQLPTNGTQSVTAASLRGVLGDMVNNFSFLSISKLTNPWQLCVWGNAVNCSTIGTINPITGDVTLGGVGITSVSQGGTGLGTLPFSILKGNGTDPILAAVPGTDYLLPNGAAGALTYTPTISGGVQQTLQQTLDNRATVSITDFGAIGDGNIANAAANAAAIRSLIASGRCARLPYTAAGYNLGTNTINVDTGTCIIGENSVHVQYSGTSAPFRIIAHTVKGPYALLQGMTIDTDGAPSGSKAILNATYTTPNGSIAGVVFKDIYCANNYQCVGTEADTNPNFLSGSTYQVGTVVQNAGFDFSVRVKGPGTATVTPSGFTQVSTATITIASPAVITTPAPHGLSANAAVQFTTTGALPTGFVVGTYYWVIAAGLTSTQFELAATPGGAAINTSGSQSGVHTVTTYVAGSDGYIWNYIPPNFVTDQWWSNIQVYGSKGPEFNMDHTRGFIYVDSVRIDRSFNSCAVGSVTCPNWTAMRFSDYIGIEFNRYDLVGAGVYIPVFNSSNWCLDLEGQTAPIGALGAPGFASVYVMTRILCDSAPSGGILINGLGFFFANNIHLFGLWGSAFSANFLIDATINNMQLIGSKFDVLAPAGANGFTLTGPSNRIGVTNLDVKNFTGNAFVSVDAANASFANFFASGNLGQAWSLNGTTGNVMFNGGSISSNGGTLADSSSGGGNRIANIAGYNPVGPTTATVGASPATLCAGVSPETWYFRQSATNTATITQSAASLGTITTPNLPLVAGLNSNECVVVTWTTTAPTYTRMIH